MTAITAVIAAVIASFIVVLVVSFWGIRKKPIDEQISFFSDLRVAFKNLDRFYEDNKKDSEGPFLFSSPVKKRSDDYRHNYIKLVERIEDRVLNEELLDLLIRNEQEMADTIFERPIDKSRFGLFGIKKEYDEEVIKNREKAKLGNPASLIGNIVPAIMSLQNPDDDMETKEERDERLSNKKKREDLDNRRKQLMSESMRLISEEIKKLESCWSIWSIITYKKKPKTH